MPKQHPGPRGIAATTDFRPSPVPVDRIVVMGGPRRHVDGVRAIAARPPALTLYGARPRANAWRMLAALALAVLLGGGGRSLFRPFVDRICRRHSASGYRKYADAAFQLYKLRPRMPLFSRGIFVIPWPKPHLHPLRTEISTRRSPKNAGG